MPKIADSWLRHVLALLYQRKTATRAEIVEATRLNVASVSHTLRQLLKSGTVLRAGELHSNSGRKPEVIKLSGEAGYFVAVDLEATRIRFGVVNLLGEIRYRWEEDLEFGQRLEASRLVDGINRVLHRMTPSERARVLSVGISCPGFVEKGDTITAVNLGWLQFPLLAELRNRISLPITAEQDSRIGAFAEHWLGAAQKVSDCVYVIVGDGIGVASVVDGHVVVGGDRMAGELGHITIDLQAEDRCNCGKKGCLEAICSSPNMVRQYLERSPGRLQSPSRMHVTEVFEMARAGDVAALAVVERTARCLGWALSHLVHLMNPHLILLGGDIVHGYDLMVPRIQAELHRHCLPGLMRNLRVQVSSLWPDIGLNGAALVAFRNLLTDPVLLRKLSGLAPIATRESPGPPAARLRWVRFAAAPRRTLDRALPLRTGKSTS